MNFAQLFEKSNSSLNQLEGNVLHCSVSEVRGDLVVVDTGLAKSSMCFHSELNTNAITKRAQRQPRCANKVVIGVDQVESVHGEPVLLYPKMLQKISRRKLVWNELTAIWRNSGSNKLLRTSRNAVRKAWPMTADDRREAAGTLKARSGRALVKGFILNSVKGGYSVAIAGYIAFLPRSLRIQRKVRRNQWLLYTILNMNPKIGNIVVKEYLPRTKKNVHHLKVEEAKTGPLGRAFFKSKKGKVGSVTQQHVHHSKKQMKRATLRAYSRSATHSSSHK